ncbi:MAG TPA: ATP-binding protein [Cytophagaceae bacterium]|jgi:PAS domain S-box-containing protein|nr:ATP-binding protein [Cytophagaceae bacterium]
MLETKKLETKKNIDNLLREIEELKIQLDEANSFIEAIKEGSIDALVLTKEGQHSIYSIESADYSYRVLIEKFREGAVSLAENGLILFCNDYFAQLVGTTPDKIIGTYFHSLVDSVGQFQSLKKELVNGSSQGEIVLNVAGKKIHVDISITDLRPLVSAIGIIMTDLSEKRKHEADLISYQRKLETNINELNEKNATLVQFIHVISHDIKEPLRKIITNSALLADGKSELKPSDLNNLVIIRDAVFRLNSLVEDLTKYSLNTSLPELEEIDLNQVVKEVIEDMDVNIKQNNAVIKLNALPNIIGSEFQMRQLFLNILNNSIKFKNKNEAPYITISAEITDCVELHNPNKKFYKISIKDNGIGIDKSYLNTIFTIFQKLHQKGEYEGNGVGLAICKKIMGNHKGKIEAESPQKEGAIFNLYFPLKK